MNPLEGFGELCSLSVAMSAVKKVEAGLVNPLVGTGSNGGKGKTSIKAKSDYSSGSESARDSQRESMGNYSSEGSMRRSGRLSSLGSSYGSDEGSIRTSGGGSLVLSFMRDTRSSSQRRNSGSNDESMSMPPPKSRGRSAASPAVMGTKRVSRGKTNNLISSEELNKDEGWNT
jgi:hypothetical protein